MSARPLLALALLAQILSGADPAELVAALQARRTAAGTALAALPASCGPASAKAREAAILQRQARDRGEELVAALVQELRAGAPDPDLPGRARTAEAAEIQLRAFLDLGRCDGTTAAPGEDRPGPELWPELARQARALDPAGRARLAEALDGLRGRSAAKGAEEPPPPRYLVIKGAFHTAAIRQMALDAREQVLVTASEDKTLRVWDPGTLACRRVLRPPMGPGDCGKLYAVVLSPDGATAVAAGFTRDPEGGGHRLYVMDVRDGRLLREIPGLPQVVTRLALSPDGTILMVHLGERMGLRRYRLADGAELGRDPLFGGPSYAGAFAADGRYAATSEDGLVRVYDPSFKLLAKARTPGPGPFGVAFSPDGATLALGYADGCRVDLLSPKTLFPIAQADTRGCQGPLAVVAWSRDGSRLYACGGQDFGPAANPVYSWADAGRGVRAQAAAAAATLGDLLPLKGGGLLVAAQDPALCRFGPGLVLAVTAAAPVGRPGLAREGLRVDAGGTTVALGWRFPDRPDGVFALPARGLQDRRDGLVGPLLAGGGLRLEGWRDSERPTLNGVPVQGLEPHEVVRALSMARNGQSFALGTDWALRIFDAQGRLQRAVALPAACWGLNHAPDGKVLVAALADGTLRWYGLDGAELMALTLSADAQHWALWNGAGYFDASAGGEGLLGWQVQRPGEAGDFFPLDHFRDRFCQPALFPALLARGDLVRTLAALGLAGPDRAATQEASLPLPPALRILEPAEGSAAAAGRQVFRVRVHSFGPPEPALAWHLYLDGEKLADPSAAALPAGAEPAETDYRLEAPLPGHGGRVSLVMESASRVSEPAHLNLGAGGTGPQARTPALNLVAIGISKYRQPGLALRYPAKDAADVVELFQGQQNRLFSSLRVHPLLDAEATRDNILRTLRTVRDQSSPWDVTLLFLSGHGVAAPGGYGFLPWDADPKDEATQVAGRELRELLARTQGKVVLMLDTCHAGGVLGEGGMRGLDETVKLTRFINELTAAANGVMVFSSSTGRQLSLESPDWGNGAFTKALREGLAGRADPGGSGRVTLGQLDAWLRSRVRELTQGAQTPVTARPATAVDFPLAVLP